MRLIHTPKLTDQQMWISKNSVWKSKICYNYFYQIHQVTGVKITENYYYAKKNISAKKTTR